MTRRIIQFGTSRFLQAHVDLFVHQARLEGQRIGPIAVVKTTAGGDRAGRVAAFKRGLPFPVRIRGIEGGRVIDETIEVASVDAAFDAEKEWRDVVRSFAREADIAVSNVGERGYDLVDDEAGHDVPSQSPPRGFPMKLLALLVARFKEGGKPLLFLPTELVTRNGGVLSGIVSQLARKSNVPDSFHAWLAESVVFADTLVDRIVSAPIEPIGAVAEPYALWAIRRGDFEPPLQHPAVQIVDDLEPFERLKLHILNLGHTVLAEMWMRRRLSPDLTVRAILEDAGVSKELAAIYDEEVLPGFALRGMGEEAKRYLATTLERFRNPFLEHRIADISENHAVKLKNRIAVFGDWVRVREPAFAAPRLSAMLQRNEAAPPA
ncbi:MAG TPA: mannitol dehydrogenase family protein [Roseiarcus sp.]|nr:mannitol dehydrogenase family protein [Roseiarcus sp.]